MKKLKLSDAAEQLFGNVHIGPVACLNLPCEWPIPVACSPECSPCPLHVKGYDHIKFEAIDETPVEVLDFNYGDFHLILNEEHEGCGSYISVVWTGIGVGGLYCPTTTPHWDNYVANVNFSNDFCVGFTGPINYKKTAWISPRRMATPECIAQLIGYELHNQGWVEYPVILADVPSYKFEGSDGGDPRVLAIDDDDCLAQFRFCADLEEETPDETCFVIGCKDGKLVKFPLTDCASETGGGEE